MAAAMLAPPRIFLSLNGWTDGSRRRDCGALETPRSFDTARTFRILSRHAVPPSFMHLIWMSWPP